MNIELGGADGSEVTGLREVMAGRAAFGGWCILPSAFSAEVLAQRGFDWVALDWQHGFIDLEKSSTMLQAISLAGAAPLVRVTANEPWIIMKALDIGAFGVIVPLVNNREEAERAVKACRYPPVGNRSYGPVLNAPEIGTDARRATENVLCFVMIETRDGLANLNEIVRTPGLDGVFIGPDDLRISTAGPQGELEAGVIDRILEACAAAGIVCGLHTPDGDAARAAAERGFRFLGIASDVDLLANAAADAVRRAHQAEPPTSSDPDRVVRTVVWSGL